MTTPPPATEERIELRGPSGRLYGVIVNGRILEVKRKGEPCERIDLSRYVQAVREATTEGHK